MAWIDLVRPEDAAGGALERDYAAAVERAGRVYQIVQTMSPSPRTLRASMGLYQAVCLDQDSPLSRVQREMVAVVVSRANDCHY